MNTPRYWMLPACLLLAISVAGCGSSSSFFMIRNPFQEEANAIADLKTRSKLKKSASESGPSRKLESTPETTPPDPRRSAYFGKGAFQEPATSSLPVKNRLNEPAKPATNPVVPPATLQPARHETVTAPRPAATGAACYRCNGKGHYLNSLNADGRLVECADCGGTGRR